MVLPDPRFASVVVGLVVATVLPLPAREFADMSIVELMNESVTSVARQERPFSESAAAVFVITEEDIRRSGHDSLPEILRIVPGMNVARIQSSEWAVSARGFADQYSNKLLVLVDGRSVYSPMFGGVYWNTQDMMLEDLDRIEVIRGPGASLWGANAVNGVINITSKSAKETQGGLVSTAYGTELQPMAAIRYGGQLAPNLYYRAYVKTFEREAFDATTGGEGGGADSWDMTRVGARLDWENPGLSLFTLQGEYYRGTVREHFEGVTLTPPFVNHREMAHDNFGGNVIARATRHFSPDSELTVQAYFDRFSQGDGDINETRSTADLDLQHSFKVGERHAVVWGAGSRYTEDRLASTFYLSFDPEEEKEHTFSFFAQDEITLVSDRLKLTLGSKFEHSDVADWQTQPSARLVWTPTERHTVWSAVSHSVRIPSRYDRDSRLNTAAFPSPGGDPILVSLLAGDDVEPEQIDSLELGYRYTRDRRLSVDLTTFFNEYDGILGYAPGDPFFETTPGPPHTVLPLYFQNVISGQTYGAELAVEWRVTDAWKLMASYSWLHMRLRSGDGPEGQNPGHQAQLRSYLDLPKQVQLNAAVYYVGSTMTPLKGDTVPLDSILRVDLGVTWRPRPGLQLGLWGQNLLEPGHAEFGSFKKGVLSEIPRTYTAKVTWEF